MGAALIVVGLGAAFVGLVLYQRGQLWVGGLLGGLGLLAAALTAGLLIQIDDLERALAKAPPVDVEAQLIEVKRELANARGEYAQLEQRFERERDAREEAEQRLLAQVEAQAEEPPPVEPPAPEEALPLPVAEKPAAAPPATTANSRERRLNAGGSEQVPVCVTKEAYDEFIQAAGRGDTHGAVNLTLAGLIFFVDANTRVLMLDSTWGSQQVRILSGPQAGLSGWVPSEWVVK